MDAARLVVDVRDPQAFARRIRISEAPGEKLARGIETFEFKRKFGTLITHAHDVGDGAPPAHPNRVRNGTIPD